MSNSEVLMNIGGSPGPGSPYPASSLLLSMLLAWLCCCEWLQHGQALAVLPTIWVITAVRLRGPSIRGGIFTFTNFCSEFVWKFYLDSFDWKSMWILSLYSELSLPLWSRSGDWESEWGLRRHGGWSLPGPELGLSVASTTTSDQSNSQTPIAEHYWIYSSENLHAYVPSFQLHNHVYIEFVL